MKSKMQFGVGVLVILTGVALSNSSVMAEEIAIVGTGSGMSLLKSVGEAFEKENPGVKIVVPDSVGSGGGIKFVGSDRYKIGRVARELKNSEKPYGLTFHPFAKLPIVFFVNKNVTTKDVTTQQICDIYSGKIKNWQEVGGENGRIKVIRREEGDSSLKVLNKSFPKFKDITITTKSKTMFSDQKTLRYAERKPNSIAFGTYVNARNYEGKILRIEGKKATDPDYPYYGVLALIFKEKNKTGNIKKFVDFVTSPQVLDVIRQAGGVPY